MPYKCYTGISKGGKYGWYIKSAKCIIRKSGGKERKYSNTVRNSGCFLDLERILNLYTDYVLCLQTL